MGFCFSATDLLCGSLQAILFWSSVCHTNLDQKFAIAAAATILPGVPLDAPTSGVATTKQVILVRFLGVFDVIMTVIMRL